MSPEYLFACAEFGTYSPIEVLAGLRAENQAHHWGERASARTAAVKKELKELFCPASAEWRRAVIEQSFEVVERAILALVKGSASED